MRRLSWNYLAVLLLAWPAPLLMLTALDQWAVRKNGRAMLTLSRFPAVVIFSRVLDGQVQTTRHNRHNQLEILMRETAAVRGPLIVAGDFKTPPRGQLYRAPTSQFDDTWDAAGQGLGHTFASAQPNLCIDHVFARGLNIVSAEVQLPGGNGHRALIAWLHE
ncbi:hypothetical protein GCM10022631_21620 [Deinococcus rubellus]|uniref:Endonuclease/exonuclease/phosphatase family protein n=1 Tax=Deinococcus rubellus TaxID=1889240 RepID=A0ABY5YH08_9DEIO|nr:endonuclease/exonuclease/phosphatase family protein [Deinococcus rubellus]UWX64339.1 endonuclease/exonuclease/phosphatase family protein [Deinococcus rubellus]